MSEITSTMPDHTVATNNLQRELSLTRVIDAPPAKVFRAWTEPDLIVQWFTPPPYKTISAEVDLRAGGSNVIVMQAPDGTEIPNRGIYLEVVKNERLVFTDAYTSAWVPSEKPFMTGILTFEEYEGKTKYTARVMHWTVADREAHEKMGFHEGWGIATDQLEALVAKLK
ncbi:MAG: SRPBCC family protein [Candidatus Melainabacteria bacterium]|nr:SRPBCC family protein [Candidatus Melainabacteria bacterium]